MTTYQPTFTSQALYLANRQVLGARLKIEQGKLLEVAALLRIKQLEALPEFQGMEDRAYVVMRLGDRPQNNNQIISDTKRKARVLKKEMRDIK